MLDERSKYLRRQIVRALVGGGRGHVGSSFSLVEILRVLYDDVVRVDPFRPDWPDRDRVVLSKGHGCLALYVMLAERGFFDHSALDTFCRAGFLLGGHPEHHLAGVEASTGALGHGLSLGVGMALAQRMGKSPSRTFVILGDGECQEGSIWEAALCAAKHELINLTVIVDYNNRQSYGTLDEVLPIWPLWNKWHAFGFSPTDVDGHDCEKLQYELRRPSFGNQPRALICHTVKGKGVPAIENQPFWHHKDVFTPEDAAMLLAGLEHA